MKTTSLLLALVISAGQALGELPPSEPSGGPTGGLIPVAPDLLPDLYAWTDVVNVFVLREDDAALLINLGDGSVLDRLHEIGVTRLEWILFTDHHREQSQGFDRLKEWEPKIGGPEAERSLFEDPLSFRRMEPKLRDPFTVHGASFVRPPVGPVPLDRGFSRMDVFSWRGYDFWCVETRGGSPGAMSYLLRLDDGWLAFSGSVMLDGARMYNYFDSEWDYGFASGIHAVYNSAGLLEGFDPHLILASRGAVIREPRRQLREYRGKLRELERLLVRGYDVHTFSAGDQDRVSRPTSVPHVWRVSENLYKFRGPGFFPNFTMILAGSGRALVVDCGLLDEGFLEQALTGMRERLGLKTIDAVLISHMHGDHFLEAPYLREEWGAEIWALDRMADQIEHPERFDYAAPIQAYPKGLDSVRVDRVLKSGEVFEWEGFRFTADWMPGQTEFAMCLHAEIDGRKVAFTGDNIFGDPRNPAHRGNEAVVARNSGILEEGYIYGAEYLRALAPDLVLGGHSYVMDEPAAMIERYRNWAYELREALQALSGEDDYRYWFDPFWVRAEPYRIRLRRGESAEVEVHVRNFRSRPQSHQVVFRSPSGLEVDPPAVKGSLDSESREAIRVRIRAAEDAPSGVRIVALDVALDERRYGELFDFIVEVEP